MEFNSTVFILAFLVFYIMYHELAVKPAYRTRLILLFNAGFYWLLSGWGIVILALSGIADYFIARAIHASKADKRRQMLLWLSVLMNIGLILTFRHFTQWFGLGSLGFWPTVAGVSFFVFRSLGYVLDVYHENMDEPESSLPRYLAFTGFFPLILQGPISPARDFLPELKKPFQPGEVSSGEAIFLLCSGIIKKYALAAYLSANFTDRVFDSPHLFTGMENLLAAVSQALLVFLDFSGYTDMMLGMGLLLGFRLAPNFNFPYLAANITEYWRRWHMSLSKWLNEYLFFPLSFSLRRFKMAGTVMAVMITFLISGFWHGTSPNYTFWGMLHGLALSWDVITAGVRSKLKKRIPSALYYGFSVLLTFGFLALSGIYFRQEDFGMANEMMKKIFTEPDWALFPQWFGDFGGVFLVMTNVLAFHWILPEVYDDMKDRFSRLWWPVHALVLAVVIFLAYQISGLEPVPFIYQKF